jgi:hypothetical protein
MAECVTVFLRTGNRGLPPASLATNTLTRDSKRPRTGGEVWLGVKHERVLAEEVQQRQHVTKVLLRCWCELKHPESQGRQSRKRLQRGQ